MHEQLVYLGQRSHRKVRLLLLPQHQRLRRSQADRHRADHRRIEGAAPLRFRLHERSAVDERGRRRPSTSSTPCRRGSTTRCATRASTTTSRTKVYNDKLKMPNFHLTQEEARLHHDGRRRPDEGEGRRRTGWPARDAHTRLIEEGRKRVSQHNCRACHVVDGRGRAIAVDDRRHELPAARSVARRRARAVAVPLQLPQRSDRDEDPAVARACACRPSTSTIEEANTLVTFFAEEGKARAVRHDARRDAVAAERRHRPAGLHDAALRAVPRHRRRSIRRIRRCRTSPTRRRSRRTSRWRALRLRHDWISDWIRRPNEMIPGTRMPTNFPRDAATGGFQSPLAHGHRHAAVRAVQGDAAAATSTATRKN